MKIAFAHHKGGSGKTTSCINVAGYLALFGKRVLVVDLDPQGCATSGMGIDNGLVLSKKNLKDSILETKSGVHIVPHPLGIDDFERELNGVEGYYDYILIDPPPGVVAGAISLSDFAIIPLDGLFALEGLEGLAKSLKEIKRAKPRMAILNKVKLFGNWAAGVELQGIEGVFAVPYSNKVHMSQVKGLPLSHFAPNSRVGRAYKKIAQEVLKW